MTSGPINDRRTGRARSRGAVRARSSWRKRVRQHYLLGVRHALAGLGHIVRRPVASAMTIGVIGISLALPAGFYLGLLNVASISRGWHDAGQASLFMERDAGSVHTHALADQLRSRHDIAAVRVVSPVQAMAEFRRLSGFGAALDALDENPLPAVLLVTPNRSPPSGAAAEDWVGTLAALEGVDFARFDTAWMVRFQAMLDIAERIMWVSAALLLLAVLLAVGNTIRLDIENRRDEIEITRLVGATDRFIRRPFLYGGVWYGALGGLLASAIVGVAAWLVSGPIHQLARAYNSAFDMRGPDVLVIMVLIGTGAIIGLGGAWLAVSRHLKAIEPA